MPFQLYDYVNHHGQNEFKDWTENLQKPHRAKLNEKLDKLALYGDTLYPHMLTDTDIPGIQKLRSKGNVQLRPLLCRGPVKIKHEYTLLMGAKEVGSKWQPKEAPSLAKGKKNEVIGDPSNRRTEHETVF